MTEIDADTAVLILSVVKLITVALGFVVVYLGAKAYRATRRKPLLYLTLGIGIMTLGAISEGLAFQGLGWSLEQSHIVEAVVTLIAFAVLVYSLYV
jgi:hypothetical protein